MENAVSNTRDDSTTYFFSTKHKTHHGFLLELTIEWVYTPLLPLSNISNGPTYQGLSFSSFAKSHNTFHGCHLQKCLIFDQKFLVLMLQVQKIFHTLFTTENTAQLRNKMFWQTNRNLLYRKKGLLVIKVHNWGKLKSWYFSFFILL